MKVESKLRRAGRMRYRAVTCSLLAELGCTRDCDLLLQVRMLELRLPSVDLGVRSGERRPLTVCASTYASKAPLLLES